MPGRRSLILSLYVLALLATLGYLLHVLPQVKWNSNISAALPNPGPAWQQQLQQQNQSSRQLSLLLTGMALPQLQQAATAILQQQHSQLQWHQPAELLGQQQQHLAKMQGLLANEQQLSALQQQNYTSLVEAAWQRLLSPAPLLTDALSRDPLLLSQQYIEQLPQPAGSMQLSGQWLQSAPDSAPAILLLGQLAVDPFDRSAAGNIAAAVAQSISAAQQRWPQLQVGRSGVLFHAIAAADTARFEMQLFGGMSLLAILLLLWLSFGSLKPLLLASLVLCSASLAGMAALIGLFEQPHLLALVFATTLIGIAIDYSFHGMLAANKGQSYFRRMLPSLTLGLATTLLGYLALTLLPFAVLNQVAVFICAGLTVAYLTVKWVFPLFISHASLPLRPRALKLSQSISAVCLRLSAPFVRGLLATLALLISLLCWFNTSFSDDVRLFNQSPAALMAEEQTVRSLGIQSWDSKFIVLLASEPEQLLQQERQLRPLLQQWQASGQLSSWQATSQQQPPLAAQSELQQLLALAYQSEPVQAYLTQLGISPPAPIAPIALTDSMPQPQIHQLQQQWASLILLRQATPDASAIAQLQALDNVYWLAPLAEANASISQVRQQLSSWLALALLLAGVLLVWRLGARQSGAIILLLLCSIGGSLLLSQLWQQQLNVFNLVAALLVLALALDYAVFFSSALPHPEVCQAVSLSAVTSCLAFGMLSFSQTPAIAAFGFTVFCGVALASVLAPLLRNLNTAGVR